MSPGATAEASNGRSSQEKAAIREAIRLASAVAGAPASASVTAGPPSSSYLTTVPAEHRAREAEAPHPEAPRRPSLAMSIKSGFIDGFARRRSDQSGRRPSSSNTVAEPTSRVDSTTDNASPDRPRFNFSFRRGSDSPQQELPSTDSGANGWRSRRSVDVVRALPSALGIVPAERRRGSASDSSGLPTPSSSGRLSFAGDELPSSRRPSIDAFSSRVRNTLFRKPSLSDVPRGSSRRASSSNVGSREEGESGPFQRRGSTAGDGSASSAPISTPASGLHTPHEDSDAPASGSGVSGSVRDSFFSARSSRTESSAGASPMLPAVALATPPAGLRGLTLGQADDDKAPVGPRGERLDPATSAPQNPPGAFPLASAGAEPRAWADSFSPHATSPSERASSESSAATGHTSVVAEPAVLKGGAVAGSSLAGSSLAGSSLAGSSLAGSSLAGSSLARPARAVSLAEEASIAVEGAAEPASVSVEPPSVALGLVTDSPAASGDEQPSRPRRMNRSHLAHMPRLNSMATLPGSSSQRAPSGDRRSSSGTAQNDPGSESETDTDSEEPDPSSRRAPPPGEIRLPPAPTFQAAQAVTSPSPVVGRDSWMRFTSELSPMTPFETPRAIHAEIPPVPATSIGPSRSAMGPPDSSYFTHRPAPSRNANGTTPGAGMPPPSPSVITRSRAPSSASLRTMRSGTSVAAAPTPNREVPSLGPITPLNLRSSPRAKPDSRPALTPTASLRSSRPSTSGDIRRSMGTSLASFQASPASPRSKQRSETIAAYGQYPNAPPTPRLPTRPSLYQQQSKSLIDLTAASRRRVDDSPPLAPVKVAKAVVPAPDEPKPTPRPKTTASLRRRRSMFEVGAAPPPYSIIHRRPEGPQVIYPREEEGREKLPLYSCAVHIEGYLPRKMEFSAPGIQAKDRSWKRLYFVLHGTCLRVYKNDMSGAAMPKRGMWGELSGDHVHLEPMNTVETASNAAPTPGSHGSTGINAAREVVLNTVPFVSLKETHGVAADPNAGLVRNYTLQGAESGLAADYLKRRHVVRVRAEGEQFLLQTRNDKHVVDWIEAFQAATNISLDLEERPMPKFITLPRRRRRRRREPATEAEREAADLAEAQRRSLAERTGGASSRANPARPLGLPGDEPSAAFEEMLREEHEDMRRQAAGTL